MIKLEFSSNGQWLKGNYVEAQAWLEVKTNGPYVVHGDVPLLEMAPVLTLNGEPIDWHNLGDISVAHHPVELCRCGQSSRKPWCDASHESNGFKAEATPDLSLFRDRALVERHGDNAIADDRPLCVSAGFCGTRTTKVWQLLAESDDPQKRDRMRDMIWRCPSGRLVLLGKDDEEREPDLPQSIAVLPGGPLWVRGGIAIRSTDGREWEPRNRVTLCRCGESTNKPFCDGTHATIGFDEH